MRYVDGYLLPVPKRKLKAYRRLAQQGGRIWKQHGALACMEATGDDLAGMAGPTFKQLLKLKAGETAIFAFILFRSRRHRDAVMKKVVKDRRMETISNPRTVPFNVKRMAYGGFRSIVDL